MMMDKLTDQQNQIIDKYIGEEIKDDSCITSMVTDNRNHLVARQSMFEQIQAK